MASKKKKAGAVAGTDLRKSVLANSSENSLDALRAQYLAEIFALPAATAVTIAELAFGEARQ
ncbi:hypothetical protein [Bradyrhizobium elkanii]|uniref:hypothetical protein n=1 Tax=Bradyrhizobium elkanii TaxID=29448 RepID=UPI00144A1F1E|nr:hypothetical protein [Bradyrhizobium elkanii]MCS3577657.1 hypothetical protein [Bradyrhizobium elkanii]MCS3720532.1 hypothetical protein [Bradyrhizobium elkanii]MCS4004949.1 hypothetical protein [Bradyrhizobium elkanii USDA 61]BBC00106.1 hypothetical protein BE61_55600 [Bradyrhizobium elkanii USDA 61]